jgi:DAK2 domain fusion protein YloV
VAPALTPLEPVDALDGPALRRWAAAGLAALVGARAEIDRLNVYPVPDADTGTNLVRTMQAGVEALAGETSVALAAVSDTLATALLRGACGNSGTILSQLLRGLADAARGLDGLEGLDGPALADALTRSAALARDALARPVEGTILSVADAAAAGATAAASAGGDLIRVVQAAGTAARAALAATPGQLAALHGEVDAGGRGLVVLLEALATAVEGAEGAEGAEVAEGAPAAADETPAWTPVDPISPHPGAGDLGAGGPSHEVMYLLDTEPGPDETDRIAGLRATLDQLGDSVLVVGGRGLWQVHAHVDDVGAALEAALAVGRPHRVRISTFARTAGPRPGLGALAVVEGPGLADLLTAAGATVLDPQPSPDARDLDARIIELVAASPASLVAVLPGSAEGLAAARRAADREPRCRVVRTRSAVQVIAALAVHDPARPPDRDLLEMATAAAGCRHGLVEVAEGEGVTSAGRCRAGDVLGHVDGDVAIIGTDVAEVAGQVVDLLLGGGGELVTLVAGAPAADGLAAQVAISVRSRRPDVDVTAYVGGQPASYLLVGVE